MLEAPPLDTDSLILGAIAGLCSRGLSEEQQCYFQDKVQPMIGNAVEFLMEGLPEEPEQALALWLLDSLGAPRELQKRVKDWFGIEEELLDSFGNPIKSALASGRPVEIVDGSSGRTKRGSAAFITPAGHWASEEVLRRVPPLTDEQKRSIISGLAMFQDLTEKELKHTIRAFELTKYLDGEEVQKQGVQGDGMHIVVRGEGRVLVSTEIGIVKPGDVFGDQEMIQGIPANETVEACNGSLTTLHVSSLALKALGVKKKVCSMTRKRAHKIRDHTVIADLVSSGQIAARVSSAEDLALIREGIQANENLKEVLHLSDDQIDAIAREAYKQEFEAGATVFERGDSGDHFYIVNDGTFEIIDASIVEESGCSSSRKHLRAGMSFGELCVIYNAPRAATIKCSAKGSVWMLSRVTLKNSVRAKLQGRLVEYAELIKSVSVFHNTTDEVISIICNALEERYFIQDEEIVAQGQPTESFYILFNGTCTVLTDGQETGKLQSGNYFGERALSQQDVNPATIKVSSDRCTVLCMDRVAFGLLLRPTDSSDEWLVDGGVSSNLALAWRLHSHVTKGDESKAQHDVTLASLDRVGILGRGAFGFVSLERDSRTGSLYALKAMSKGHIVQEKLKSMVQNEKACMSLLHSPFVVRLVCTSKDQNNIYFVLEPCFGGELFDVYAEHDDIFGSERHCLFYAACVALGLEHMHSRHVIYRDLKLENCLVTSTGYLKLTDLGIGKVCVGKTYTVCGTADYFAPETLRQTGHNRAVDWWALGVMMFIMMTGRSPFDAPDTMKIYRKIMKGMAKVSFPGDFPEHGCSIIKALCQKNPEERLTMGTLGVKNFQDHPWYRGFSWKDLKKQKMPAPWVPSLTEEQIVAKAQAKNVEQLPQIPYEDDGTGWDACFDKDYTAPPVDPELDPNAGEN